jgi:hypothetical protein
MGLNWRYGASSLDHLDRGAYLLGQEIDIHPFGQAEGRIGVAEAVAEPSILTDQVYLRRPDVGVHLIFRSW